MSTQCLALTKKGIQCKLKKKKDHDYCFRHVSFERVSQPEPEIVTRIPSPSPAETVTCECICCMDEFDIGDIHTCGNKEHVICKECFESGIKSVVGDSSWKFSCVYQGCKNTYNDSLVNMVLTEEEKQRFKDHKQREMVIMLVNTLPNFTSCPKCEKWGIQVPDIDRMYKIKCKKCKYLYCTSCRSDWHEQNSCGIFCKTDSDDKIRIYVEKMISRILIKKCPSCKRPITKTHGCNHMKCVCGTGFCYLCGELTPQRRVNGVVTEYWHFSNQGGPCPLYNNETGRGEDNGNGQFHEAMLKKKCTELILKNKHSLDVQRKILRHVKNFGVSVKLTYLKLLLRKYTCMK